MPCAWVRPNGVWMVMPVLRCRFRPCDAWFRPPGRTRTIFVIQTLDRKTVRTVFVVKEFTAVEDEDGAYAKQSAGSTRSAQKNGAALEPNSGRTDLQLASCGR